MWQANEWEKTQNQQRSQWGTDCSSLPLSLLLLISSDMSFLTLPFTLSLNSLNLAGFYIYLISLVLRSVRKNSEIHAVCSLYTSMCTLKNTKSTEKSHPCFSFSLFHFSRFSLLASAFSTSFSVCETLTCLILCPPRYNYALSYSFNFPSCFLSIPKRESSLFKYVSWSQKILT